MATRGKLETERLRINITAQLNRLLQQLEDLEEFKEEFTQEEYEETKTETNDMLNEFQTFLNKAMAGDLTLIDEFGNVQLAIQAAISKAFKTPEVIRMFAKRQPTSLRKRYMSLQRDLKIKHITQSNFDQQAYEILMALRKLGETISSEEEVFLEQMSVGPGADFENAFSNLGFDMKQEIISAANIEIQAATT